MNTKELKQSILNIQESHRSKMEQTHKTFFKKYKKRSRTPTINSVLPISPNTMYTLPEAYETVIKESKSSSKMYFGVDKRSKINFNRTGRTVFTNQMNTCSHKKMATISNYPVEDEANINQIFSTIAKGEKYMDKDSKQYLYSKYNIERTLSENECKNIRKIIRPPTSQNKHKVSLSIKNDNYSYNNPFKSLKAMKQNLQLAKKIEEMRNNKLVQLCHDKFDTIEMTKIKTARMPKIKIVPTQKQNEMLESIKQKYITIFHTPEGNKKFENYKKITREDMLKEMKLNITYKECNHHPPSRTQFASVFNKSLIVSKLYVFGGLGGKRFNDLWECTLNANKFSWNKIKVNDDIIPYPRYGHTMHIDDKKMLYIIGGIAQQISLEFVIENEILIMFDLTRNMYIPYTDNTVQVPFRRNHNSIMIGHIIMINGGIDINNNYLSDSWLFNTQTKIWSPLDIKGRVLPPLGYHSSAIVIEKDRLLDIKSPIYAKAKSYSTNIPDIKQEGVYFFGGMNDNRIPTNMLFIMKLTQKPVEFYIPNISGKPPSPRISSSMNFYPGLNMIIIHGGRNDLDTQSFYNDYYLIDLETMNWIRPIFGEEQSIERAEHCSFINHTKLYIFGGVNMNNFMNFDLEIVNLDFFHE